ncbi:DUF1641 domain-containing protein [Alicyclobacillus cycloheptanicus]|uniref:DUF1641 domain-containing protein n=1 Tax=Alicyclobacillus cycloheptanicus TaxID=1457 RepID=A0ABT9XGA1_9BACL|nr:DUF1641 domain-containing protein [Alicyclobacillus cycloheptanicus]MDQ0189227.1 hypothetical protein [Alicyclobacillus cycloheptanicus]WDM00411.1 DUF1641 domain-containing protein [Alicyclobacillus cycloheptanicus]
MPIATQNQSPTELDELLIRPEIQQALTTILQELPKLAAVMTLMGKAIEAGKDVLTDGDTLGALEDKVKSVAGGRVQDLYGAFQEARKRAEADRTEIGIFGIMRMLKDPVIQKSLRFVQAFCNVIEERQSNANTPQS